MNFLIDDIFMYILDFLPILDLARSRRVNKKWKTIISHRYDNQEITIDFNENFEILIKFPYFEFPYKSGLGGVIDDAQDNNFEFIEYRDSAIRITEELINCINLREKYFNEEYFTGYVYFGVDGYEAESYCIYEIKDGKFNLSSGITCKAMITIRKNEIKLLRVFVCLIKMAKLKMSQLINC